MKYFTIKELTDSVRAVNAGIDNTPSLQAIKNLELLVDNILDPLRERLGKPIIVTSGYRSKALNTLVGGATKSEHLRGCAVDFIMSSPYELAHAFRLIKENYTFNQLIWEKGNDSYPAWVHVSYVSGGKNKLQVLRTR